MKLAVRFTPVNYLQLPLSYQQALQGLIYHIMEDREFAEFLHDEGFLLGKRTFRLFTFSRLQGDFRFDRLSKKIAFDSDVQLQIGSIVPKVIQELGRSFLKQEKVYLNGQPIQVQEVSFKPLPDTGSVCRIRMLSPITIYSTYEGQDGRKVTQYFDPDDAVFSHLIGQNLRKKFQAYYNRPMPGDFAIKPIRVTGKDKVITRFKDFIISGWNGVYELRGEPEVLQFASGVGIGGKNTQGFGMFELV